MKDIRRHSHLPAIGSPIAGTVSHILDPWMQPRPFGTGGELLLGGAGVARGYLGRPDLTAERFLPDPFAAKPGSRLYASGDSVRRLADGDLDFVGRKDSQVKIRGFRIELGEITAALRSHPAVRDAHVLVRADAQVGGNFLAAYVVASDAGRAPTADELRAHLANDLPAYMLPSAYVHLPVLPLNRSGKVDQRALPAPDRQPAADRLVAPASALEARLAELGLAFNAEKSRDLYFTGAGRPSLEWPEARGTTSVEFLGMRIGMDGTVSLGGNKVRDLLRDARRRARNTARALGGQSEDERGRATAAVVNALLDSDGTHLRGSAAPLLAGMVTDRRQLDWLDHQLARIVAGEVSGDQRAAAFRRISYRTIRNDWALVSLRLRRDRQP